MVKSAFPKYRDRIISLIHGETSTYEAKENITSPQEPTIEKLPSQEIGIELPKEGKPFYVYFLSVASFFVGLYLIRKSLKENKSI